MAFTDLHEGVLEIFAERADVSIATVAQSLPEGFSTVRRSTLSEEALREIKRRAGALGGEASQRTIREAVAAERAKGWLTIEETVAELGLSRRHVWGGLAKNLPTKLSGGRRLFAREGVEAYRDAPHAVRRGFFSHPKPSIGKPRRGHTREAERQREASYRQWLADNPEWCSAEDAAAELGVSKYSAQRTPSLLSMNVLGRKAYARHSIEACRRARDEGPSLLEKLVASGRASAAHKEAAFRKWLEDNEGWTDLNGAAGVLGLSPRSVTRLNPRLETRLVAGRRAYLVASLEKT